MRAFGDLLSLRLTFFEKKVSKATFRKRLGIAVLSTGTVCMESKFHGYRGAR